MPNAINKALPEAYMAYLLQMIGKKTGINYDLNDPNYNYRAALQAGDYPTEESGWHWLSKYKGKNHPNRYIQLQDGRFLDTLTDKVIE